MLGHYLLWQHTLCSRKYQYTEAFKRGDSWKSACSTLAKREVFSLNYLVKPEFKVLLKRGDSGGSDTLSATKGLFNWPLKSLSESPNGQSSDPDRGSFRIGFKPELISTILPCLISCLIFSDVGLTLWQGTGKEGRVRVARSNFSWTGWLPNIYMNGINLRGSRSPTSGRSWRSEGWRLAQFTAIHIYRYPYFSKECPNFRCSIAVCAKFTSQEA